MSKSACDLGRLTLAREKWAAQQTARSGARQDAGREPPKPPQRGLSKEAHQAMRNLLLGMDPYAPETRAGLSEEDFAKVREKFIERGIIDPPDRRAGHAPRLAVAASAPSTAAAAAADPATGTGSSRCSSEATTEASPKHEPFQQTPALTLTTPAASAASAASQSASASAGLPQPHLTANNRETAAASTPPMAASGQRDSQPSTGPWHIARPSPNPRLTYPTPIIDPPPSDDVVVRRRLSKWDLRFF